MPNRWSHTEIRDFALRFPETSEDSHFGRPDLRVRRKIFVTLPEEDPGTVILKTTPLALDMLVRSDDSVFRDAWGGRWVGIDLERIDPEELCDLILEAYCLAAPKKLGAQARESRDRG